MYGGSIRGGSLFIVTQLCVCRERNAFYEDSETCISHVCISDICISERQDWLGNDPRYVRLRQPRDISLHAESMSQHAVSGRTGSYERTDQRRSATPTICCMPAELSCRELVTHVGFYSV